MRCPHCAAPLTQSPVCLACGMAAAAPAQHTPLDALEPTRHPAVTVVAPKLHDLIDTHAEAAGGTQTLAPMPTACVICGHDMLNTTTCPGCGARRVARLDAVVQTDVFAMRRCGQCGTPNSPTRALCIGCASRLEAPLAP